MISYDGKYSTNGYNFVISSAATRKVALLMVVETKAELTVSADGVFPSQVGVLRSRREQTASIARARSEALVKTLRMRARRTCQHSIVRAGASKKPPPGTTGGDLRVRHASSPQVLLEAHLPLPRTALSGGDDCPDTTQHHPASLVGRTPRMRQTGERTPRVEDCCLTTKGRDRPP